MIKAHLPKTVLLDTCAIIYWSNGEAITQQAADTIKQAGLTGGIWVSPVSAWEIGLLSRPERPLSVDFMPDAKTWFARVTAQKFVRIAELTYEIAIDSSRLPQPLHGDPADRLLIATARALNMAIVTRDKLILAYAAAATFKPFLAKA